MITLILTITVVTIILFLLANSQKGNDMLGLLDELISPFTDTAKDIFGVEEGSITDKSN